MTDPAADAARSAAAILAADLGPDLPVDVEAALAARDAEQRPDRYVDVVAIAALIVSIAQLAWPIYTDRRDRAHDKQPQSAHDEEPPVESNAVESIAREVRVILRDQDAILPANAEHITEVVVTEVIRYSK